MVWQKRSSIRIYESSSMHALIIGGIWKIVIGVVIYSKACLNCDDAYNMGE